MQYAYDAYYSENPDFHPMYLQQQIRVVYDINDIVSDYLLDYYNSYSRGDLRHHSGDRPRPVARYRRTVQHGRLPGTVLSVGGRIHIFNQLNYVGNE